MALSSYEFKLALHLKRIIGSKLSHFIITFKYHFLFGCSSISSFFMSFLLRRIKKPVYIKVKENIIIDSQISRIFGDVMNANNSNSKYIPINAGIS